ncbi:hypothetical protein QBC37DRAFT_380548 [Rhypophila decipiens]|uniref:Uncharacterized protein n=1 Tax=Rhypophila decipiens TaxID=261697 RepID=A0AAN7B1M8_9PEZI|nr:hypothetical protein QBC37DRAFT_380548 [Rhypophila decipiens]
MCRFHVHLKKISWPEDVRSQIDRLARNVLLEAAQPIKHFVLRIDFADDLSPLGSALDRAVDPLGSYYRSKYGIEMKSPVGEEGYKNTVLEYVKAVSAVLGGVLRNVEVARVHVEGCKRFPQAVTDPSVLGVTQAWEERMMSSAEDHPASPLPAMFWAMEDLLNKYKMSDVAPYPKRIENGVAPFWSYIPVRTDQGLLKLRELMEQEDEEGFLADWQKLFAEVRVPKLDDKYWDPYHRIRREYAAHLRISTESPTAIEQSVGPVNHQLRRRWLIVRNRRGFLRGEPKSRK